MNAQLAHAIRMNPDFVELERTRSRFGWTLTVVMLVIYYAFILLVAFAPGLMAIPFAGPVTLGFPLGLGVILSAIVLTGVYVFRANGRFDELTERIAANVRARQENVR